MDQTWFTGASWTRPIFDLANTVPTAGGGGNNNVIYANGAGYLTVDNIEIKGQAIPSGSSFVSAAAINFYGALSGTVVSNMYIHDFVTNAQWTSSWTPDYDAGGIYGAAQMIGTTIDDSNGYGFTDTGVKVTRGIQGGACETCGEVSKSKFVKTMGACFTTYSSCHDSQFTGISQSPVDDAVPTGFGMLRYPSIRPHTQIIEEDCPNLCVQGVSIYNNWIHDNSAGMTIAWDYSAQIYNNVMSNNFNAYIYIDDRNLTCRQRGENRANRQQFDGLLERSVCVNWEGMVPGSSSTLIIQNNHLITDATPITSFSGSGLTVTGYPSGGNNITMSTSTATLRAIHPLESTLRFQEAAQRLMQV